MKEELTSEILDKLGFSPYDDEHCTWGNRRLTFSGENGDWKVFSIIEYGDYPENDEPEGFVYAGWFDRVRNKPDMSSYMRLNTVNSLIECIKQFRPELLDEFMKKVILYEQGRNSI